MPYYTFDPKKWNQSGAEYFDTYEEAIKRYKDPDVIIEVEEKPWPVTSSEYVLSSGCIGCPAKGYCDEQT